MVIPVNEPLLGSDELALVQECVTSGWVSSAGRFLEEFEQGFAAYCGRRFGVAMNTGTSALIAALRALDLPPGSEVLLPTFTIISCALACLESQLVPVFADADAETWCLDVSQVERKLTARTRAIMPVHIYGHPAEMDRILEIASRHELAVVEDFAEAIGSTYHGRRCGSFGDVSCTSFYANKTITTGEGGMCVTDSEELASRLRSLRNLCFLPGQRFVHRELGFNFRMTNIQAAIGLAQLGRINQHVARKIEIGRSYSRRLQFLEQRGLIRLCAVRPWVQSTYWMFGLVLEEKLDVEASTVLDALAERGIEARPFFFPLHLQPALRALPWYREERLPVAQRLAQRGLYLPSGLTLAEKDIEQVVAILEETLGSFR